MLYLFLWQHTIVPVLPQSMKEIASAPTPFILGLFSKNVEDSKSIYPDQVQKKAKCFYKVSFKYFQK
jgi:hypothetical protein